MDLNTAIELIRTLGSIASISSGYLNVKRAIIDSDRVKRDVDGANGKLRLEGTLTTEEKTSILQDPVQVSFIIPPDREALQIISPELLESATIRFKTAKDRYTRVVMQGQISEIEEEEVITRGEICYFLSIILKHNGGEFPIGSSLKRVWQEFRCTLLYPYFGIRSM